MMITIFWKRKQKTGRLYTPPIISSCTFILKRYLFTFESEFLSGYEKSAASDATETVHVEHFVASAHHEVVAREAKATFRALRPVQPRKQGDSK